MTETLCISNVTLIDGTGSPATCDTDIIVRDGRILGTGPGIAASADAQSIDAAGMFLIPGLWDTETHLTRPVTGVLDDIALRSIDEIDTASVENHLAAYLRHGVTTVVDLGGPEEYLADLRQRQDSGDLTGARVLFTGRQFTAAGGQPSNTDGTRWATVTADVHGVEDARKTLLHMIDRHQIDAVKANLPAEGGVHGSGPVLSAEIIRMLVEEGHKANLPVHVHIDTAEAALTALECGVDNIEHMFEPDVRTLEADIERVTELCLQTGAYWPFTIVLWEGLARLGDESLLKELDAKSVVLPHVFDRMLTAPTSLWNSATDATRSYYQARFEAAMRYLPQVHSAGVRTTMATDAGAPPVFHGPSAIRELILSVDAGLSPMDVLLAATRDSARKLRRDADLGTLVSGKIADMVLLQGNPLEDIENLHKVHTVFQSGKPTYTIA